MYVHLSLYNQPISVEIQTGHSNLTKMHSGRVIVSPFLQESVDADGIRLQRLLLPCLSVHHSYLLE